MKHKPWPTLADNYIASAKMKLPFEPPASKVINARRFVLDEGASSFLAKSIHYSGDMMMQQSQFARAPYDLTWVELQHKAYFGTLAELYDETEFPLVSHPLVDDHFGSDDDKVGFLIDHGRVWSFASANDPDATGCLPISYDLHKPMSIEKELEMAELFGRTRMTLRVGLFGSSGIRDLDTLRYASEHTVNWHLPTMKDKAKGVLYMSSGDLKLVLGLLLILSRPGKSIIYTDDVGHRHGIMKGKRVVYHSHNLVKLHLSTGDPVKRFMSDLAHGSIRRRHDVRGHWCQTKRTRSCAHDWIAEDPNRFECTICHGKRWWRKTHCRGDAGKGVVTKTYEVTE